MSYHLRAPWPKNGIRLRKWLLQISCTSFSDVSEPKWTKCGQDIEQSLVLHNCILNKTNCCSSK